MSVDRRTDRRGFTLLEMLIAVGAVTLIALGLSRVFTATGETVRVGRRVSNLNEYASMLERQLRSDVASMSREGFLVIKHRVAVDSAGFPLLVQLAPDQPVASARNRRVDELTFFATGRFNTQREAVHPSRIASGTAARIYFGHGVRYPQSLNSTPSAFDVPQLDDGQAAGSLPSPLGVGVNQYASDWCLLRHVTVLNNQLATALDPFPPTIAGLTVQEMPDNDLQVALQPAMSSIFANQARLNPPTHPGDGRLARDGEPNVYPAASSGLVDIATTDLQEIRQTILDAQPYGTSIFNPDADSGIDGGDRFAFQADTNPSDLNGVTSNMKRWMIGGALPGLVWNNTNPLASNADSRMRFEFRPPDLLGVVSGNGDPWPENEPWRRVDQMMLSASNFVPHCTEFIVEWSFGKVYTDNDPRRGQLIWHGLLRRGDINGNGQANTVIAAPYRQIDPNVERYFQRIERRDGTVLLREVDPRLIHFPPEPAGLNPGQALYSCFGYLDPTYTLTGYPNPATIPWAWPKLLRITISLVDPTDPLNEQTFQFVIEVPDAQAERF
jgi:prepilin-type N-terminal cleavage/methylation domain-containing protein